MQYGLQNYQVAISCHRKTIASVVLSSHPSLVLCPLLYLVFWDYYLLTVSGNISKRTGVKHIQLYSHIYIIFFKISGISVSVSIITSTVRKKPILCNACLSCLCRTWCCLNTWMTEWSTQEQLCSLKACSYVFQLERAHSAYVLFISLVPHF